MPDRQMGRIFLTLFILLGIVSAGCSGKDVGVCGNGIQERGEECDCGGDPLNLPEFCYRINGAENSSCSAGCETRSVVFTKVILNWTINGESFLQPGQSFDTCTDVDGAYVRIQLEGPGGYVVEEPGAYCTSHLVEFVDDPLVRPLLAGHYQAWLELQTGDGTPLAPLVLLELDVVDGIDNHATADFALEDFYDYDNMLGEFGVRAYWGADLVNCGAAVPPVVDRVLTLTKDGSPLAGFPQADACSDSSLFFDDMVPGDYQLQVEGFDHVSALQYCEIFDVKVGAGIQPSYFFVVPPAAMSLNCTP